MTENKKVLRGMNFPGLEGTYYIDAISYNEQTLTDEQKLQAQINIGVENKLDVYVFTGTFDHPDEDEGYIAYLDDNYKWNDMLTAINAKKYVLCILYSELNLSPVYLVLSETFIADGYVVFTSLGENGYVYELTIFENGTIIANYNEPTTIQIITWEEDD